MLKILKPIWLCCFGSLTCSRKLHFTLQIICLLKYRSNFNNSKVNCQYIWCTWPLLLMSDGTVQIESVLETEQVLFRFVRSCVSVFSWCIYRYDVLCRISNEKKV